MRIRSAGVFALAFSSLLHAADEEAPKKLVTRTDRMEFPAAGTLRLKNSFGEVAIEGWDQPDIEVTTIKSALSANDLKKVNVALERRGEELVVSTTRPENRRFPPVSPFKGAIGVAMDYRIKVPSKAAIVVDHLLGEVHVEAVTGDIRVTVHNGGATLRLPPEATYTIDAKSDIGGVISDFPGHASRRRWLFGHRFVQEAATGAHTLYLRVGFGDITILETRTPVAP